MMSNLGFANLPLSWGKDEDEGIVDFSRVFDEDFQDLFPTDTFENGVLPSVRRDIKPVAAPQPPKDPLAGLPHAPIAPAGTNPFVNVLMIVDPETNKVICPKQVLTYEVDGRIEKVVFGPTVLDSFPREPAANFTQQMDSRPAPRFPNLGAPLSAFQPVTSFAAPVSPTGRRDAPEAIVSGKVSPSDSSISNSSSSEPPLRALSAYNFFFRDERERILHGGDYEFTSDKQKKLLGEHWNRDRSKKRRHRKTHGKIDFTTLSKLISQRWKDLSEDHKEFYRQIAAQDWDRYQRELNDFKKHPGMSQFQAVVG